MDIKIEETGLSDLYIIRHEVFRDSRGFFQEVFRSDVFEQAGKPLSFVQVNHSRSAKNTVRGLHFQWDPPMGKMMRVIRGAVFMVAVDIRRNSSTLGEWFSVTAVPDDNVQLFGAAGFARGFCALEDDTEIEYLCTGSYNQDGEAGILWNDPAIGIEWPVANPLLSDRDKIAPTLEAWLESPEADHSF